jgi:amino acid transporter
MKKTLFVLLITFTIIGGSASFIPLQTKAVCTDKTDSSAKCYESLAPLTDPATKKDVDTSSFPSYLQAMYRIGIGACFVLGVIMFTWAGIEYIVSESMNTKEDAKKRINAALIGLAIALVSYILLNTINPDLLKLQDLSTQVTTNPTTK